MKYIILVPDGVADEPLKELDGKTPLEAASIPNMDAMAKTGMSGLVRIIPEGLPPGSDIGNLSVMGYDPAQNFSGRAPLEAANMGIQLADDELAFRCNVVTVKDGIMVDYSAGHITTPEAVELIGSIQSALGSDEIRFYPGKSYRHIAVIKTRDVKSFVSTKCTPPHDIMGQKIDKYLPTGPAQAFLRGFMERSVGVLEPHKVNLSRIDLKEEPANMIWLWGQGTRPHIQSYKDRWGVTGSIISAVDLVNGIGRLVGLEIINVPGATGYYDTNYKGKADYAMKSLEKHDFVYVHVEATDEAGHNGDIKAKMEAVENFDRHVVGTALEYQRRHPDTRILVTPDHPTPLAKRTHTSAPVPFVMCGKGIEHNGLDSYNELSAATLGVKFNSGVEMVRRFMGR